LISGRRSPRRGRDSAGGRCARPCSAGFEALIGAIYPISAGTPPGLIGGLPRSWPRTSPHLLKSPKSRLQEFAQQRLGTRPAYRLVEAVGPDHDKVFRVEVEVAAETLGMGVGPSRRQAETAAAAEAIAVLEARAEEESA
jgi:dsRNA-specific ribonuclease